MASFHVLRIFYDYCYEMKECWEGNGCDTKTSFTTFLLDPRKVVMHYILILNWLHGLASVTTPRLRMSGAVLYFPYTPSCRQQRRSTFYRLTSLIYGGGGGDGDGSD